jgi:hypothetical protein
MMILSRLSLGFIAVMMLLLCASLAYGWTVGV